MRASLLSSFFVLSSLWQAANSIYPDCVPAGCGPLQQIVYRSCNYDISKTANATGEQTVCICGIPSIVGVLQECFNCLDENPDKENSDYFSGICPELPITKTGAAISTNFGVSSAPPTKTGVTIATATTITTGVTGSPLTTDTSNSGNNASPDTDTDTDTDTDSSPTGREPTVLVDLEPTATSTGAASHYTPVFGLAAIMLMAQVGL